MDIKLSREQIDRIIKTIKTSVKPDKIYLFGSYAANKATASSDLDLLIVDDSKRDKKALALQISKSLFPRNFGLDLLVTSSEELKKNLGLGFWREIIAKGEILYERN